MNAPIAVRTPDETLDVVNLRPRARRALAEEAAFRRISVAGLCEQLLEAIADDDRFAELLDRRQR